MIRKKVIGAALGIFCFAFLLNINTHAQVQDFLHVPGPMVFMKSDFRLAWSAHPNDTYYKQEYLKSGEPPESFKEMIMVEFLEGKFAAKDLATLKANELEKRKATDKLVNYEIINSPDGMEYILDFVVSNGAGEELDVVEWNAYRYKQVKEKSGKKGVLLMAVSKRAYGEDITAFLQNLKSARTEYRNELIGLKMPEINLAKK